VQYQVPVHPLMQVTPIECDFVQTSTSDEHSVDRTEWGTWHCHCPQADSQICFRSFQDQLTGLPNRFQFYQQLASELALAQKRHSKLALMIWDLDHFQAINQEFGYALGDQILQQVAQRLTAALRIHDWVIRWQGNTFALMLPNLRTERDACQIAQRLYDVLHRTFYLQGHEVQVQSSLGMAIFPQDGETPWHLLSKANAALQIAKESGRNTCAFYSVREQVWEWPTLSLEQGLRWALDSHALVLHYQPQINLATGTVNRVEALLRWQHPELGLVSPSTFMAQAEASGLIVPIGLWVLRQACWQNRAWEATGLPPLRMAVNISARQLQEPDLAMQIDQILVETGLPPQLLEVEITETAAMQDLSSATQVLQTLRSMGVQIALDDFGTGYSSLSYLKSFPVQYLKLDRSFIQDIGQTDKDTTMLSTMISLAQELKLGIVAEGVETLKQVNWLRSHHCYEIQGYWFSHPLSATAMTDFLLHNHYRKVLNLIDWQLPLLEKEPIDAHG
jgi:diguanylate cyclase (GGDEF)-like protein